MGIFSNSSSFDSLLDKATSQLLLEPDWNLILQICDSIRQEDVNAKYAVAAMKKKFLDKNPHVAKFALIVLEVCVKNCGSPIHKEVATKELMDSFRELVKTGPEPVKEQVLTMIQTWSHAFRKESKYKWVQDTYNLMKMEGYKFPPLDTSSDALFTAETAPEWAEGDVCHMCRVKFSTFQRQHHCRSCGQVFCHKCSSRVSIIPQYGIEREVRVCDPCYYKLNPGQRSEEGSSSSSKKSSSLQSDSDLPLEYLNSPLSKEAQIPPKKSQREIQEEEEEELQLAMALSLSQEEATKESQMRPSLRSSSYSASEAPYSSRRQTSRLYSSTVDDVTDSSSMDPELQHYLNRSYWEERNERQSSIGRTSPSASAPAQTASSPDADYAQVDGGNFEMSEAIVKNFQNSVEMLLERMQKVSGQGKHIAMDATVQSLFQTVSAMHPQILRLMEEQEQEKAKYEAIQVKLGLVREARASLEEMREQHREKIRQQELEQDMLRRMQIEQKLELMRQQKAEYLAYQQRLQTERQAAIEQQQRLQYQRQMQQQQQQYGAQYIGGPADSSPYSSLNYVPMTAATSQAYNTPTPAVEYAPQVAAGYQLPDATPPPQYPSRPSTEGYMQTPAPDYLPYRVEASAPQTVDSQPSSLTFQQPNPLDYQLTSVQKQPPSYGSQVQPLDQGPASLQPYSVTPPSQVVPTAPAQMQSQAPPPQYAQVTSHQQQQQQQQIPQSTQYVQKGAPPSVQYPSKAPAGQPPFAQMASPQGQPQYPQPVQQQPPQQQQPQYSQPQQQPLPIPPDPMHPPQALPQSFQNPPNSGYQPSDTSRRTSQPQFQPTQIQPQANMAGPLGPQPFQQVPQMQNMYEPQQQQQFAPQAPYQPATPQPPHVQQPTPPQQYYGSASPPQQSGPVPQRQMSDLELISFD